MEYYRLIDYVLDDLFWSTCYVLLYFGEKQFVYLQIFDTENYVLFKISASDLMVKYSLL